MVTVATVAGVSFLAGAATLYFVLRNNRRLVNKVFDIDDIVKEKIDQAKSVALDLKEKI